MNLSAQNIYDAVDLAHEDVTVPEWPVNGEPGQLRLAQLDAAESIQMTEAFNDLPKMGMFIIFVYTARDPQTNERLFPLPDAADARKLAIAEYVLALKKKNFDVLNRLQRVSLRVNKMGTHDQAATKNASSEAPTVASPSDSPKS